MSSFQDLYSTVGDLMVFMRALIRGELFDDPATVNLMHGEWNQFGFSISPVGPGWPIEYGLGMMRLRYPRILTPFRPVPDIIGHTGASGSWLFYCPPLDLLLAGNVSQITAAAVPFQFVPKLLRALKPFFS
jgi:D-alanyl-D-alanine carboxypeptidase